MLRDKLQPNSEQARSGLNLRRRVRQTLIEAPLLMVLLAGCGTVDAGGTPPTPIPYNPTETAVPTSTQMPTPPIIPTPTTGPAINDIYFTPGKWQCANVPAYSVVQGDGYWNGKAEFDNNAYTGSIGKVLTPGQFCTSYGADVIETDQADIDQVLGKAIDDMASKGCVKEQGCSQGITIWVAKN